MGWLGWAWCPYKKRGSEYTERPGVQCRGVHELTSQGGRLEKPLTLTAPSWTSSFQTCEEIHFSSPGHCVGGTGDVKAGVTSPRKPP